MPETAAPGLFDTGQAANVEHSPPAQSANAMTIEGREALRSLAGAAACLREMLKTTQTAEPRNTSEIAKLTIHQSKSNLKLRISGT